MLTVLYENVGARLAHPASAKVEHIDIVSVSLKERSKTFTAFRIENTTVFNRTVHQKYGQSTARKMAQMQARTSVDRNKKALRIQQMLAPPGVNNGFGLVLCV